MDPLACVPVHRGNPRTLDGVILDTGTGFIATVGAHPTLATLDPVLNKRALTPTPLRALQLHRCKRFPRIWWEGDC